MQLRSHKMKTENVDCISGLPPEIFEKIFESFNARELASCCRVSRRWRDVISRSDFLWSSKCKQDFEIISKHAKQLAYPGTYWYSIYRNLKLWPTIGNCHKKFNFVHRNARKDDTSTSHLSQGILLINDVTHSKIIDIKRPNHKSIRVNAKVILQEVQSKGSISAILFTVKATQNILLYLQNSLSTDQRPKMWREATFPNVKKFVLFEDEIFFSTHENRVIQVDLSQDVPEISASFHTKHDIQDIAIEEKQNNTGKLRGVAAFTEFAKIVRFCQKPEQTALTTWSNTTNYLLQSYSVLDAAMFICYRNKVIFMHLPTKSCFHYGFPKMKLAELYGDNIILVTTDNRVLLFSNLLEHDKILETSFIVIGSVPRTQNVLKLCIMEANTGPVIMISTNTSIYIFKSNFSDMDNNVSPFNDDALYGRLLKLRDRIEITAKEAEEPKRRASRKRKFTD